MATENLTVKVGANIKDFEKKMSKMQGRMDKIGGKFQSIGSTFTKGSALIVGAATAAGAGLYGLTNKVTQNADAIAKGSERMGVSTKAYQEMDFWASQNGLSQENMEKVVGRLNQRLGLAVDGNEKYASALEKLGVDLNGVRDGTVSTEDAMAQSIQTLSTMENENEKAALASELFGTKMSRELLPALNDGSLSMEDAKKKAQELGLVMSDDQLKAAEAFQDAQDQIKRSLGAVGMQIGLDLMPHFQRMHEWILANLPQIRSTISGAFESVIDTVKSVIDWWQGLSDRMKTIIPVVSGLALAFGPIMLVVGKVINIVSGLIGIFAPMMTSIAKAGGLIKWLAPLFSALTGPIGITVGVIAALGAAFVVAYKKSETFRNFIDGLKDKFVSVWESVKEFGANVKTAFEGIFALFQGNDSGIDLLKSLGLTDDQISMITGAVDRIKETFETMKENVMNALDGVKNFFIEQFQGVKDWWDSDGAMILSAMSTHFEGTMDAISNAVKFGLDLVVALFETFAPIVEGIWNILWPTILLLVENVWEKIKMVIGVAMDLVQGIISGVAAIIEGDWERFGEILKETTLSIKDRIVEFFTNMKDNSIELFNNLTGGGIDKFIELKDGLINRAIEIKDGVVNRFIELKDNAVNKITEMYNSVTQWFSDLWSSVSNTASNIKKAVTNRFTEFKDNAIGRVEDMFGSVTGWFSDMKTNVSKTAGNIKTAVTNRFTEFKDNAVDRSKLMYEGVKGWFGDTYTNTKNRASNIRDGVSTRFTKMKENAVGAAGSMWEGVSGFFSDIWDDTTSLFDNMVDGAKELPGRIGSAIKNMASKAVDGVASMGKSLGDRLGTVVNGVVNGLNSVLGAIGVKKIPTISISTGGGSGGGGGVRGGHATSLARFSTGTMNGAIAEDMVGIVNDRGPGNGFGGATQELIRRDGKMYAPKGRDVEVGLKRGDEIFNGAQTQSLIASGAIPRFSQGTGTEGGDSGEKKGLLGTLKDVVSNVWGYISDPKTAFGAIIDTVTPDFGGLSGFFGDMASGAFSFLKDKALSWLTGIFKENEGALGSGQKYAWMNHPVTAGYSPNRPLPGYPAGFNGGRHYGVDFGTPIGTTVRAPIGGQLSSFWNEGGGKIAKLVTGQLRQFWMHMSSVSGSGSVSQGDIIGRTGNSGKWTTGAHVHYQAQQGSDALNTNTINPLKVINGYSNGGIVSKRQFAEIAEDGPEAIIPLSSSKRGRANQIMDSVDKRVGRDDSKHYDRMINNQQTQIDQMTQAINVLLGIENKSGITENDIGRANDKYNARQTSKRGATTGRLNYV